jgi:hypothetical protein
MRALDRTFAGTEGEIEAGRIEGCRHLERILG